MAVDAMLFYNDGYFAIDLYPGERRLRIEDEPPVSTWDPALPFLFRWDGEKLDQDTHEFLGLTVLCLDQVTKHDLAQLEHLDLPRVNVPAAGLIDVDVVDLLRWAQAHFRGQGVHQVGWGDTVERPAS